MIIIDVRTKGEYDTGHVNGALHCDIMDMMQGVLPNVDKNEEIVLYCESGNRSMMAQQIMQNTGFTNVLNGGGIEEMRNKNS